jgi:F-type H+-transporting ATPase subunit alpha
VKKIKEFEEHFLLELENKFPEVLAEIKKGAITDESLKKVTELSSQLVPQYK